MRWLALCMALAAPAQAETAAQAARAAQAQLAEAQQQLDAATTARDRIAALTGTVKAYETGLSALRDGLRQVSLREADLSATLEAKSGRIAQLLGVLQTMEHGPAPLLLLHPSGPVGTARSGMILADVTPALKSEADALKAELTEVSALRALQDEGVQTLQDGLNGAQTARAELSKAMSSRTDLPRRYAADPVAQALLVAGSDTLDSFVDLLGQMEDVPGLPIAVAAKGDLPQPVAGSVLRGFNERDAAGIKRPGVVIETTPRALVTAPMAATLRFAGPLLDFDTVVVLEPATDTLIILAGMGDVLAEVGEVLQPGAPLGLMAGKPADNRADVSFSDAPTGAERSETLYIEVREKGQPVSPATWFALKE